MSIEQETDLMLVKDLMDKFDYKTALKICEYPNNIEEISFIIKRIKCYLKMGKFVEALELCLKYENQSIKIINLKIKTLIRLNEYDEALKIIDENINENICENNNYFISQKINIYIHQEKYAEALELCSNHNYAYNNSIIYQKLHILSKMNRIDDAIDFMKENNLWNDEQYQVFKDKFLHQKEEFHLNILKKIRGYLERNNVEKALKLCSKYKEYSDVEEIAKSILDESPVELDSAVDDVIEILINGLYNGNITLQDIQNALLDEYQKDILLLAYYEKISKTSAINYLKTLKQKYTNEIEIKNLNKLSQSINNKRIKYFDIQKYIDALGLDLNMTSLKLIK